MSTTDATTEAFANARPGSAEALPDYAPVPQSALAPALNEQGQAARCNSSAALYPLLNCTSSAGSFGRKNLSRVHCESANESPFQRDSG